MPLADCAKIGRNTINIAVEEDSDWAGLSLYEPIDKSLRSESIHSGDPILPR